MKRLYILSITLLLSTLSFAQDAEETFNGTRILNGHSIETLKKKTLQFRIEHRFGDLVGANGGVNNFYGFDQAADIRFAFEYGILDNLMVGIGRSKGTSAPYKSLLDGFVKYRVLTQNKAKKMPVSVALFASTSLTYEPANPLASVIQHYPEFAHRMAYSTQINIARKFGERISLALIPTYVHRNLVNANDVNGLFALGGAFNIKIASMAKVKASEAAANVTMETMQLLGNVGFIANTEDFAPLIQRSSDCRIKGGTNRIHKTQIYEYMLAKK